MYPRSTSRSRDYGVSRREPRYGTGWRRPRRRSEACPMAMRTSPPRNDCRWGQGRDWADRDRVGRTLPLPPAWNGVATSSSPLRSLSHGDEDIAAPKRFPLGQGRIRVRDRTACSTSFSIPMAIPIPIPTRAATAATSVWSGVSIESQRDSGPQPGVAELARLPRVAVPLAHNRNAVVASSDPVLQSRPGFPRWTPPQPRCGCSRIHG